MLGGPQHVPDIGVPGHRPVTRSGRPAEHLGFGLPADRCGVAQPAELLVRHPAGEHPRVEDVRLGPHAHRCWLRPGRLSRERTTTGLVTLVPLPVAFAVTFAVAFAGPLPGPCWPDAPGGLCDRCRPRVRARRSPKPRCLPRPGRLASH